MNLTEFSLKRRTSTLIVAIALVVFGLYGLTTLPINLLPNIVYPYIGVEVSWSGATAEEVEENIARYVERALASIEGIHELNSDSREGSYRAFLAFEYDVSLDTAFEDVVAQVQRLVGRLPDDVDTPMVRKWDPQQIPILEIMISSDSWNMIQLRDWADNWFMDYLLAVPGVAGSEVVGGLSREIQVQLDTEVLKKYDLSLSTILNRIGSENLQISTGNVRVASGSYNTRTMGYYKSIEEIRAVLIKEWGSQKILLGDIATIRDTHEETNLYSRLNGIPCIRVRVNKQSGANTVEIANAIYSMIDEIKPVMPTSLHLTTMEDQSTQIRASLDGIVMAVIQAVFLLIAVVFLFLGKIRQVFSLLIALPVTLIFNFAFMTLAGFTLNLFSLGGLVIAVGVIVDNSTVVLENITRFKTLYPEKSLKEIALEATAEVRPAIIASTLSFLVLFLPFVLLQQTISLLFKELIFVIAGIVVISLVVAISLTPALTTTFSEWTERLWTKQRKNWVDFYFGKIREGYGKLLKYVLEYRVLTVIVFVCTFILALWLFGLIRTEFIPQMDDGRVGVYIHLPTGVNVDETNAVTLELEEFLQKRPEIQDYYTFVGGRARATITVMENIAQINIQLKPKNERQTSTSEFAMDLMKKANSIELIGGRISVHQKGTRGIPRQRNTRLALDLYGKDIRTLYEISLQLEHALEEKPYISYIRKSLDLNNPEFQVHIDRVKASDRGIPINTIASTLRTFISGSVVTKYHDNKNQYNVRVIVPDQDITSRQDIENFLIPTASGQFVRLKTVADVLPGTGPVEIERKNQLPHASVDLDITNMALGEAVKRVSQDIQDIQASLPLGYQIKYGGEAEMMEEMVWSILMLFFFAVFFSFVILVVQFNRIGYALQILLSIPFCLSGIVFILFLSGFAAGATVIIGMLIVVSATVNDGVLIINYAELLSERHGYNKYRAIRESATIRLRPRLMTTTTTICGFIPLAMNFGEGGDILQPMAIAAIGGLLFEFLVALFLMPCVYTFVKRDKKVESTPAFEPNATSN